MNFPRYISHSVREALKDTPVVFINGPRQSGKSTLTRELLGLNTRAYVTLDDVGQLEHASQSPIDFLSTHDQMTIDEVQRLPDLFLSLKLLVDRDRRAGRFLLTGSANILLMPKIADSLAGRMEVLTLLPLSRAEINGTDSDLISEFFLDEFSPKNNQNLTRKEFADIISIGGFPEVQQRLKVSRREAWFNSYITTLLQRDVRDLANIEGISKLPNLLKMVATRAGTSLNLQELSRTCGIPSSTLKRYLQLLQTLFLIDFLPAWATNRSKRLVKSPKIFLSDTGLLTFSLGLDPGGLIQNSVIFGKALENFVLQEIRKRLGWSSVRAELFYFRTQEGAEVDLVLEAGDGRIVGIEVKAKSHAHPDMFKGMRHLKELSKGKFIRGIVLYMGHEIVPFGPDMIAIPVSLLNS
jgi:hypothetical protein